MVKVFKNFKEVAAIRPGFTVEAIHGGALLGVVGADAITFYDWNTQTVRSLLAVTAAAIEPRAPLHLTSRKSLQSSFLAQVAEGASTAFPDYARRLVRAWHRVQTASQSKFMVLYVISM